MSRYRSRNSDFVGAETQNFLAGTPLVSYSAPRTFWSVTDEPGLPHSGKRFTKQYAFTNAQVSGTSGSFYAKGHIPLLLEGLSFQTHCSDPYFSESDVIRRLNSQAARLNPATVAGNKLNFLYELKDLPSLLHKEGRNFLETYGTTYLRQDFGWNAIVRDTRDLFVTCSAIDRIARKLLKGKGKVSSLTTAPRYTLEEDLGVLFLNSNGYRLRARVVKTTVSKDFFFVEYKPGSTFMSIWGDLPRRPLNLDQLTSGLVPNSAVVWNALPWSWMIDWAVPVGDYLAANSNSAGFELSQYWHAEERTTNFRFYEPNLSAGFKFQSLEGGGAPYVQYNSYVRTPHTSDIRPEFPLFSSRRAGTMSALAARMAGRRQS